MEYGLAVVVLLALVALVVTRPLLRRDAEDDLDEGRVPELEAAKEAKYREIRDAELDFRMGKIDEADYRRTDRELRDQAIEILRRLDELPAPEEPAAGR